jgi:hypothetical protein
MMIKGGGGSYLPPSSKKNFQKLAFFPKTPLKKSNIYDKIIAENKQGHF